MACSVVKFYIISQPRREKWSIFLHVFLLLQVSSLTSSTSASIGAVVLRLMSSGRQHINFAIYM